MVHGVFGRASARFSTLCAKQQSVETRGDSGSYSTAVIQD